MVAQVTLFFHFHYRIVLADGGFLVPPTMIDSGHLFNPVSGKIVELTRDPARGRRLTPPPE